jgi:hypothetical protein
LTRPVRLSSLAALDLQQARNWFDQREAGLGDRFLESVEQAIERISASRTISVQLGYPLPLGPNPSSDRG